MFLLWERLTEKEILLDTFPKGDRMESEYRACSLIKSINRSLTSDVLLRKSLQITSIANFSTKKNLKTSLFFPCFIIVINYVHGKFNIKNRQKCRSVESITEKKNYYENISAFLFFSYCLSQNVVYPKFLFFSLLRRLRVVSNKNCVVKVLMLFVKLIKL